MTGTLQSPVDLPRSSMFNIRLGLKNYTENYLLKKTPERVKSVLEIIFDTVLAFSRVILDFHEKTRERVKTVLEIIFTSFSGFSCTFAQLKDTTFQTKLF